MRSILFFFMFTCTFSALAQDVIFDQGAPNKATHFHGPVITDGAMLVPEGNHDTIYPNLTERRRLQLNEIIGKLEYHDGNAWHTLMNSEGVGAPNGAASLDSAGKVPLSQINDALIGAVNYQGLYDASTNTPPLPSPIGNKGKYFVVSVPGTQQGFNLSINDWIICNGQVWGQLESPRIQSVNGKTGVVTINSTDVGLGNANNTSDANKPVSIATQTALNLKANSNGSNATGNWGIDIDGNAASATNADNSDKLDGIDYSSIENTTPNIFVTLDTDSSSFRPTNVNLAKEWLGINTKANIDSPTFTGSPKAPTQFGADNSTNIATTAFVQGAISAYTPNIVVQTITNGVTTSAPSQDAVFDALAGKVNTNGSNATGTWSNITSGQSNGLGGYTYIDAIASGITSFLVRDGANLKVALPAAVATALGVDSKANLTGGNLYSGNQILTEGNRLGWRYSAANPVQTHHITGGGVAPMNFTNNYTSVAGTKIFTFTTGIGEAASITADGTLTTLGGISANGDIKIEGNNKGLYLGTAGFNASIVYNSNGNLDITPRTTYHTIFKSGRVGIGTNTPLGKLQSYSTDGNYAGVFGSNGRGACIVSTANEAATELFNVGRAGNAEAITSVTRYFDIRTNGDTYFNVPIISSVDATLGTHLVRKSQMDAALATKATDTGLLHTTGNEFKSGNLSLQGKFSIAEGLGDVPDLNNSLSSKFLLSKTDYSAGLAVGVRATGNTYFQAQSFNLQTPGAFGIELNPLGGAVIVPTGVNANEAVNVGQMNMITLTDVITSAASVNLSGIIVSKSMYITYKGSATTWTAPPVASFGSYSFTIYNMGTGALNLNSASPNTFYSHGLVVSTVQISPGKQAICHNNGEIWIITLT